MDRQKLKIAEPCPKNFDEMEGDGHRRFCDHCDKHVTNLSDLTRDEALTLLRDHADSGLCVVYMFDRTDRVRFRDDLNFRRPSKLQLGGAKRLLAAAAIPLLAGLAGCHTAPTNAPGAYKPIDEIIDAEERFFEAVGDLLNWNKRPDYDVTVGGLEPPEHEMMGEPADYDMPDYDAPPVPTIKQIVPPPPHHIESVRVELMGDVDAATIEQLQMQALEDQ